MAKLFLILILLPFVASMIIPWVQASSFALNHVDAEGSYTLLELVSRAARRSQQRLAAFRAKLAASTDPQSEILLFELVAEYAMSYEIGTPGVLQLGLFDTGSDLIWNQCGPCINCYPQSLPIFDPSLSSTFSLVPCTSPLCLQAQPQNSTCDQCIYYVAYGDKSFSVGVLGTETLKFIGAAQNTTIPNLTFGCGLYNNLTVITGTTGISGFSPGSRSLVNQLGIGNFSYCLATFGSNKVSLLQIGSPTGLSGNGVASTPLAINSSSDYYYLSLGGISVGSTLLSIPATTFAASKIIIDSGTSLTYLPPDAYAAVAKQIVSLVSLPEIIILQSLLCFDLTAGDLPALPAMTFHFDGADMILPVENYMLVDNADKIACLTMSSSGGDIISILGTLQQQNMNILYDLSNKMLSFAPAQCGLS